MNWFRWYSGTASDPKFLVVAKRAGQSVAAVIAVWALLLERASECAERNRTQANADERGCITGFDCEAADAVLGLTDGAACAIVKVLEERGLIACGRIANWEKRQPKREDGSAERAKAWREKQRENAGERNRTQPNARGEESREDKNNTLTLDNPVNVDMPDEPTPREGGGFDAGFNLDGPGMEFVELRDAYNAVRLEGQLDGFAEYKQLKAKRDPLTGRSAYPGNARLIEDFLARKEAGVWNKGFEIGLARYLRTELWTAEIVPRAAPSKAADRRAQALQGPSIDALVASKRRSADQAGAEI